MRISDWSSDVCSSDLSGMILWVAGWGAGRRRLEKSLVRDFSSRFRQAYDMIEHRRVERAREGASVEQAVAPRDGRLQARKPGQRQPDDMAFPHREAGLGANARGRKIDHVAFELGGAAIAQLRLQPHPLANGHGKSVG